MKSFFYPILFITICGTSLHLQSIQPTQLRNRNLDHTCPTFLFTCSNSYTGILDSCSLSYACMPLQFIDGMWYDISRKPTRTITSMKVCTTRNITHKFCVCDCATLINRRPVSRAAAVLAFYRAPCPNIIRLLKICDPSKVIAVATILPAYQLSSIIVRAYS